MEKSSAPLPHVQPQQLLYTSPPNGYHQYSPTSPHLPEHDEDHHMMALENTKAFHSRKSSARSSSGHQTKKSSSRKVKRKGGTIVKRFYNRWIKGVVPSFSSLLLAVFLWYVLGVLSIGTSKLLLMIDGHHRHRHHHPLIGGVPPLYLSLQQLVIGAILLRFLLNIRFLGSPGLAPWPLPSKPRNGDKKGMRSQRSAASGLFTRTLAYLPPVHTQLVLSGFFFALGFLMTNYGFSGSSASFVETIKAAEPITSATVAVGCGIEVLSRNEVVGLAAIVFGVILGTAGNSGSSESFDTEQYVFWKSFQACTIVMFANLCFSFRGLYQKLFRATPEGSAQLIDDLNLQFRMQQTGIALLVAPVLFWDAPRVLRYLWTLHFEHGLWSSGVTSRYVALSLLNGFAFASYNLASTYILSRISVVHHAALNCVRRVFAIVITSLYFVVPITFLGSIGILVSFGGFMYFTHYKLQRQRQPKPLSSLLPVSLAN